MSRPVEDLILEGARALGIVDEATPVRVTYLSRSLFPLYEIRRENGSESVSLAVKVMKDPAMARSEEAGLAALREGGCAVPATMGVYGDHGFAALYMELIREGNRISGSALRANLERLYSNRGERWGWESDNFIGSLPQKNSLHDAFTPHFWEDRLEPNLKRARESGLVGPDAVRTVERILVERSEAWGLDAHSPRLIHGDLWSGNLLPSRSGEIYLIDPSVSWGHPEQDLAMLQLFGSPLQAKDANAISLSLGMPEGLEERVPFWQIYPILIHINIFGSSYVSSLERIMAYYA